MLKPYLEADPATDLLPRRREKTRDGEKNGNLLNEKKGIVL